MHSTKNERTKDQGRKGEEGVNPKLLFKVHWSLGHPVNNNTTRENCAYIYNTCATCVPIS